MTETNGTTPALESASPKIQAAPRTQRQDRIYHLYWVKEGNIAKEMGVDVRGLCGHWVEPPSPEVTAANIVHRVVLDGDVIVDARSRDCKNCVRVYAAAARRKGKSPR